MAEFKALFLNCTLKRSPDISNTEALCRKVIEWFDGMDVESEIVRVVDYHVPTGVTSDEGDGDEWPIILDKVKAADILVVATPIWFGVRSSVCQLVIERLDGTYSERNERGQYPLYNKVAGVVVTGNEDGAHAAAETSTVTSASYQEGLLWRAIGANPPGAKAPGYGSWAKPPRIEHRRLKGAER